MKWYFLFFLICFCAFEILRLLPTGFRELQTNNFTKMAPDKALSLSVCVCECHRDTMTHSQCVSLCSLSWCRYAWLVSLSLSLSLSLSTGWLGPLSAALKALMSSWGEISACIISKPHCLHKHYVAYTYILLFFFRVYFCFVLEAFHTMKGIFNPCDSWLHLMTVSIIPYLF